MADGPDSGAQPQEKVARSKRRRSASWGGPAKGASTAKPRHYFDAKGGPGRGHTTAAGEERRARRERQAEEMRELMYGLASDPVSEDYIRLQAADHLLDRIEGKPIQRVYASESDPLALMTDSELETEIARQRELAEVYERSKSPVALPPADIRPDA